MVLLYVVYAPLHVQFVRKRHIFSCKIIYTPHIKMQSIPTLEMNADTDRDGENCIQHLYKSIWRAGIKLKVKNVKINFRLNIVPVYE